MFLRNEKKSPGWAFIALGVFLCAWALAGLTGMFGPDPIGGRAGTLTVIGIPAGVIAIIIGLVALSRQGRDQKPPE